MNSADLIRQWLRYSQMNGIRAGKLDGRDPELDDLRKFLATVGFSPEDLENVVRDEHFVADDVETEPSYDSEEGDVSEPEYTESQINTINQVKRVMKDKDQRLKAQLLRILRHE